MSACRPAADREAAKLDSELLAAIDRIFAPVPRFSGQAVSKALSARFESTTCPAAFRAAAVSEKDAQELRSLGEKIGRLTDHGTATPGLLRLQALWSLLARPDPEGIDRVVRLFQAARAQETASRDRINDLAASLLLRAELKKQPEDFAAALDLLEPLIHEQSPADAVLANDAYALQCLTLGDAAATAWRRLSSKGAPETAEPQRAAPGQAEAAPLGPDPADPLVLRRQGEWLLGEWAVQSLTRQTQAGAASLRRAEEIGSALAAKSGDRLLLEAASTIRQAAANPARLRLLEKGHSDFHSVRGHAIYSQCRPEILSRAEEFLAAAGSPFAGWVRLDRAVCAYFDKSFAAADAILVPLRRQAESDHFLSLQGRAEWMLGLIRMVQARFVESDRHYAAAIDLFTRLGEDAHAVYIRSLRAKGFEFGGALAEAWKERLAALSNRQVVTDPERRYTIFEEAAQAMRRQGHPAAALGFLSERMRASEAAEHLTGGSDLLMFTLLARADLLSELGRHEEAKADLARAEEIWPRLPSINESRHRLRIDLDVQSTDEGADSLTALAATDRALRFYSGAAGSLGDQIEILRLRHLRAKDHLRLGQFEEAQGEFLRGIAEVERQRLEVAGMEERARFLAEARSLYLDLVRLELDHLHDPSAALETFERSTNRVLADLSGNGMASGKDSGWVKNLKTTLPPETLVVRYGHLKDRLLIWSFFNGTMELEQHALPENELKSRVESCREALRTRSSRSNRDTVCNSLASLILPRPLRNLPPDNPVLLIPDEVLAPLSFAALRLTPDAPYLVESHLLTYSPALASWATISSKHDEELPPPRSALFVSDPAFNPRLFNLPRLRAARDASPGYAAHYQETKILTDRQATKSTVLAALGHFEVFQFDGHGIINSQIPEKGGLLVASPEGGAEELASSLLTAGDLQPEALKKVRLVILGACSTGLTSYRDTAEVAGLASAFLARGVPEVVATAWDVPDDDSAQLLGILHRALARGKPAGEALRTAQIRLSRSSRDTRTWSAFQSFRSREN